MRTVFETKAPAAPSTPSIAERIRRGQCSFSQKDFERGFYLFTRLSKLREVAIKSQGLKAALGKDRIQCDSKTLSRLYRRPPGTPEEMAEYHDIAEACYENQTMASFKGYLEAVDEDTGSVESHTVSFDLTGLKETYNVPPDLLSPDADKMAGYFDGQGSITIDKTGAPKNVHVVAFSGKIVDKYNDLVNTPRDDDHAHEHEHEHGGGVLEPFLGLGY